jgi:predicted dehydrogenase
MTRFSHDGAKEKSWCEVLGGQRIKVGETAVPFDAQMERFVRVVRGEAELVCSGEEGLSALIVCMAARKAMDTGEAVNIKGDLG